MARLGVNIDHVATLRQARGEFYPLLTDAADLCLSKGCDQITIHLREDRRHIQDQDVFDIKKITDKYARPLNLEMGCAQDIIEIAKKVSPSWICLVPEKREEKTTEGGLDLSNETQFKKIKETCESLKSGITDLKISLFLEASMPILEKAVSLGSLTDAVEIHTGDYAKFFLEKKPYSDHLSQFEAAYHFLKQNNVAVHAGHGLTDQSLSPLLDQGLFEEYNIGHWIISQSVFDGLGNVVERMISQIKGA